MMGPQIEFPCLALIYWKYERVDWKPGFTTSRDGCRYGVATFSDSPQCETWTQAGLRR